MADREDARVVAVAGGVQLIESPRSLRGNRVAGGTVAEDGLTGEVFEQRFAAADIFAEGGAIERIDPAMMITVAGDFVP